VAAAAEAFRQGASGAADDVIAVAQPWGFELDDVSQEVLLWHGTSDHDIPLSAARQLAGALPRCRSSFVPDRGHLLFIPAWETILDALRR
jgi:pimeloyl-ACP methyl ester carboxylesterase